MRKIFTLFLALMTLVSASAGPKFVKSANVTKTTTLRGQRITPQSGQKPAKVAIAPTKQHGQKMAFGTKLNIQRAQQNYECTYNECTYEDYGSDTWFSITTSDNAYKFYFDILLSASAIQEGETYTMADCDPSFTYISDNTTYKMIQLSDLSLQFTKDEQGKLLVEATCITAEENDTYHLKYAEQVRPETFTDVQVEGLNIRLLDFAKTDGLFQFTGKNDDFDLGIAIKTKGDIVGEWTTADLLAGNYTYLYKEGKMLKLCDVELQVSSLGDHNFHINAKMYAYDGNAYVINADYVEPTKQNEVSIKATDLKVSDEMFDFFMGLYGYGLADITASNDDYSILGSVISYSTLAGHYEDNNHMINELFITNVEGKKTDCFSSNFDLQKDGDNWTIKGKVLCWDNTEYDLDLCFTIPEIKGEMTYTCTEGELNDQTTELGAFQIYAMDEEWNEFSVALPAESLVAGHYDELSEENKNFCYIYFDNKVYQMYSANFDLSIDGETFTLTGNCQGGDQLWTVNISGSILPSQKTDPFDATYEDGEVEVNYTLDEVTIQTNAEQHYAYIEAVSEERNDVWMCLIYFEGDKLPAGIYGIEETFTAGSVQPGIIDNGDIYPTMYFRLDEEGYVNIPVWYCSMGQVKVEYDANDNIVIDCDALNSNYVRVHVTVNAQETDGIQQLDGEKVQKDGKFLENRHIVIRRGGQKFNVLGQQMK